MARPHVGALPGSNPAASAPGNAASKGTAGHDSALDDHGHALTAYGTGAGTIAQGNDSRFTDARTPTGTAGGDLSGTYPNPKLLFVAQAKWAVD